MMFYKEKEEPELREELFENPGAAHPPPVRIPSPSEMPPALPRGSDHTPLSWLHRLYSQNLS